MFQINCALFNCSAMVACNEEFTVKEVPSFIVTENKEEGYHCLKQAPILSPIQMSKLSVYS